MQNRSPIRPTAPRRVFARRVGHFAMVVSTALIASTATMASAAADTLPVPYDLASALIVGLTNPVDSPPGANEPGCRPSAAHPRPVVLVNGTSASMRANWDTLAPLLHNNGYCVYAFNTGGFPGSPIQTVGPIQDSAAVLARVIDTVLSTTGASQVDLVGHSEGGTMARYYTNKLGGADRVHNLIGLAPGSHGTTFSNIISLYRTLGLYPIWAAFVHGIACAACEQQAQGSPFIADLNSAGDTVPGPHYTTIATETDEISTPHTGAFLEGPNTTNITVQTGCAENRVGHLQMVTDRRTTALVLNALDPDHPQPVPCLPEPWLG